MAGGGFFTEGANYEFAARRLFTGIMSPRGGLLPVNIRRGRLFWGRVGNGTPVSAPENGVDFRRQFLKSVSWALVSAARQTRNKPGRTNKQ